MNNLKKEQLEILGFENNEVWLKNREMLGHKDGEDFETFFHKKHGYPSHQHLVEITKRNLTLEERIQKLENPFKQQHDDLRINKVFLTLFPWHYQNFKSWDIINNCVISSNKKSKGHEFEMPKEFTLFAVLQKDDNELLLSYMHNSSNIYNWEHSTFQKQLHITTLNKDGIFTTYDTVHLKPRSLFKNTKIPDISILGGKGSIYDLIVYNHVKTEEEISKIGNLLKDVHSIDRIEELKTFYMTREVENIKSHNEFIKNLNTDFKTLSDNINILNKKIISVKPTAKLINLINK